MPKYKFLAGSALMAREAELFLNAVRRESPAYLLYYTLAFFCGIRPGELKRLDQVQIDLRNMQVLIPKDQSKICVPRMVQIPSNAKHWLLISCFSGSGPILLPSLQNGLGDFRKKILRGLALETGQKWKWLPNGPRHSCAIHHLVLHSRPAFTAQQLGINPEFLIRHFVSPLALQDAKAYFNILPA